ncbi:MAG: diguanylate cyclase [Syntrophobacteraceae bacterium]
MITRRSAVDRFTIQDGVSVSAELEYVRPAGQQEERHIMHPEDLGPRVSHQDILVVDDEPQVCELLSEALTFLGHKVEVARDGKEAMDKIMDHSFTIVITDMDMPVMDGMELIKHMAEGRIGADIIAITGHSMKYKYTDVVAAGAADFIAKPFTLNELEAKVNRLVRERNLRDELERLAIRDPLTGLYNRRFFEQSLRREAIRAQRYDHSLFMFFSDIDHFKDYNDQNGHQAGDVLLVRFADILTSFIREAVDAAFRLGGDEFTVLLPHLPRSNAVLVAERIREKFNEMELHPTTLSIGIARYLNKTGDAELDIADMIRRSDKALYHAKHHLGGDRICFDQESSE